MDYLNEIINEDIKYNSIGDIMDHAEKYHLKTNSIKIINNIKKIMEDYLNEKIENKDILSDPKSVINYAKMKLKNKSNENFMIIFLNTKNEVINSKIHSVGTIDQNLIYPRRIVKECLDNNAAGMIIFHNHPSGHCYPSKEDLLITKKIKNCLKMIDVNLLDHIIIGSDEYYSFQEEKII